MPVDAISRSEKRLGVVGFTPDAGSKSIESRHRRPAGGVDTGRRKRGGGVHRHSSAGFWQSRPDQARGGCMSAYARSSEMLAGRCDMVRRGHVIARGEARFRPAWSAEVLHDSGSN